MASLLLIFFYAGKKIGRLETQVSDIEKKVIAEREWGALKNQVETLYNVYVIEALSSSKKDTNSGKSGQGREDVKELVETIISDSWSFPALRP